MSPGDEGCARGSLGLKKMVGILKISVARSARAFFKFLPWKSLRGARGSRRCEATARRSRAGHMSGPEIACV